MLLQPLPRRGTLIRCLLLPLLLLGCSSGEKGGRGGYEEELVRRRREKDSLFRGEDSPIPTPFRAEFPGLRYYPPVSGLVFELALEPLAAPDSVSIAATGGETRRMLRIGHFHFTVDGQRCTLAAYRHAGESEGAFVPFRDQTNGEETYEGGRYLDAEPAGPGRYRLDFNDAYAPYCAYNPDYSCPIVPRENILPVAIRAGEMTLPGLDH